MTSEDLLLALTVARVAMRKVVSYDAAAELIGETLSKDMRPRHTAFLQTRVRPSRRTALDVAHTILKVKAVCRFTPTSKTVHSLLNLEQVLDTAEWTITVRQSMYLLCYLEEGLLVAFSGLFTIGTYAENTKEALMRMVRKVISRIDDSGRTLTSHLISVMAQLVFLLSFPGGCENECYSLFTSVYGISASRRPISRHATDKLKVVCVDEIIKFHVDVVNVYCNEYDNESKHTTRDLILACLLLYGEDDIVEYAQSLLW